MFFMRGIHCLPRLARTMAGQSRFQPQNLLKNGHCLSQLPNRQKPALKSPNSKAQTQKPDLKTDTGYHFCEKCKKEAANYRLFCKS